MANLEMMIQATEHEIDQFRAEMSKEDMMMMQEKLESMQEAYDEMNESIHGIKRAKKKRKTFKRGRTEIYDYDDDEDYVQN